MNKQRRNEVNIEINKLRDIISNLNSIKSDEEYSYDSIPENLQNSIRASDSEEAIETLDEAIDNIDEVIDQLMSIV